MGLRQGEALGLRWSDADLEARTRRLSGALQRIGGAYRLVEPKTQRSRRTLRLPKAAVAALRAHKVRQLEERMANADRWADSGLVFTTEAGAPIHGSVVTHRFQKLLQRAG